MFCSHLAKMHHEMDNIHGKMRIVSISTEHTACRIMSSSPMDVYIKLSAQVFKWQALDMTDSLISWHGFCRWNNCGVLTAEHRYGLH